MNNTIVQDRQDIQYTPIRQFYARIGFYTVLAIIPLTLIQYWAYIHIINAVVTNITCK